MTTASDILVVIPTLNEARRLSGVLDALLADPVLDRMLIVVCDGGSTDQTCAIAEAVAAHHPQVRLVHNPKRLQSAAVNLALRTCGEGREWLVRVDAHAAYPAHYVSKLIACGERTGADSVTTPMVSRGEDCFQRAAAAAQNSPLGTGGSAHRRAGVSGWVEHGHHALFRSARFAALGGYDEDFSHNEDAEFDTRLVAAGGRIWLEGDLAIGYYPRSTPTALFRQYLRHGDGRARTVRRHKARLKLRQLAPLAIAPAVLIAAAAPWFWPLGLPAAIWALACLGYGLLLGLRARDPCAAASGLAAMIAHLAWSIGFWRRTLAG